MAVEVELFYKGRDIPANVAQNVTVRGQRGLELVPGTTKRVVQEAGAGSVRFIGVAREDKTSPASGPLERVDVVRGKPCRVISSGSGSSGDPLITAAGGTFAAAGATPDARTLVGKALQNFTTGIEIEALIY